MFPQGSCQEKYFFSKSNNLLWMRFKYSKIKGDLPKINDKQLLFITNTYKYFQYDHRMNASRLINISLISQFYERKKLNQIYFYQEKSKNLMKSPSFQLIICLIIYSSSLIKSTCFEMQEEIFKVVNIQKLDYRSTQTEVIDGRKFWSQNLQNLLKYEETCIPTAKAQFDNGILGAFLEAYNKHGDVKITPDDIWITIMIYFSKYVTENSEQLKTAFIQHEGKKKLTVTTWNQLSESQWGQFFDLMIIQIKKHTVKGVTKKLESDFSTTGRLQKIISTATIMSTFQKYFDYGRIIPDCGIQNVHFGGTLQDWKKILLKLKDLSQFDRDNALELYIKKVSYILQKFIQTYQGNVDVKFWNSIINQEVGEMGSGSTTYFSGWLINLFGFFQETEEVKMDSIGFDIEIDNKITGIVKTVKFVGGFRGISKEGHIIRPHLSMAIIDSIKIDEKRNWLPCFLI